jgi:outer membrane protein TolC
VPIGKIQFLVTIAFLGILTTLDAVGAQNKDDGVSYKPITLNQALEQGLKDNHDQRMREYERQILELQWKDSWTSFWFPKIELTSTVDTHRFSRLRSGTDNIGTANRAADGGLSLDLGEFTVFNWGKDYLQYLNNKESFFRNKQGLNEGRRHLKQDIVLAYFQMITQKKIEIIKRDQLRNSSFVYRLNRHRVTVKKISRQEYYQSRAEFLRSQQEYYEAKRLLDTSHETLAYLLDDVPGTRYVISETLKFEKLEANLEAALDFAVKNSPDVLAAKNSYDAAERSLEIARRSNLPLPKFTIDFGAHSVAYGKSAYSGGYATDQGSNIELVATLNATWTIFGEKGFFNARSLEQSHLQRGRSSRDLLRNKDLAQSFVRRLFDQVATTQKQYVVVQSRAENARKTYNATLDNYTKGTTAFMNYYHALREYAESQVAMAEIGYLHLQQKIYLARYAGLENFPGERFEDLALKSSTLEDIIDSNEMDEMKALPGATAAPIEESTSETNDTAEETNDTGSQETTETTESTSETSAPESTSPETTSDSPEETGTVEDSTGTSETNGEATSEE